MLGRIQAAAHLGTELSESKLRALLQLHALHACHVQLESDQQEIPANERRSALSFCVAPTGELKPHTLSLNGCQIRRLRLGDGLARLGQSELHEVRGGDYGLEYVEVGERLVRLAHEALDLEGRGDGGVRKSPWPMLGAGSYARFRTTCGAGQVAAVAGSAVDALPFWTGVRRPSPQAGLTSLPCH